jgi:hypothetical protein
MRGTPESTPATITYLFLQFFHLIILDKIILKNLDTNLNARGGARSFIEIPPLILSFTCIKLVKPASTSL